MIPTTKPPIWFLDVDGVINAIVRACPLGFIEGEATPFYSDDADVEVPTYPIKYNPKVIEKINHIHDSGLAEVMWLTTWGSGANFSLRTLLGVNKFKVASEPPGHDRVNNRWGGGYYSTGDPWWKLDVVQFFYEEDPDRGYVWTDDDLALEKGAREWAFSKKIFTVSPLPHESLSMVDASKIEEWLKVFRSNRERHETFRRLNQ